MVNIIDLNC